MWYYRMMTRIDFYLLREFSGPFLACVAGLTVILLGGSLFELSDLILRHHFDASTVLKLLVYRLPGIVSMCLPIGVLFGVFLAVGRLSGDNELTALLAAGIPFRRVMMPLVFIGMTISAMIFMLDEEIVPSSNHKAETLFRQALFKNPMPLIEEKVFLKGPQNHYFYIEQLDSKNKTFRSIMIFKLNDNEPFPELITADRGWYEEGVWYLQDGIRKKMDEQGYTVEDFRFAEMTYPMAEEPIQTFGSQKTVSEMSRKELKRHIDIFKRSGFSIAHFEVSFHMRLATPFAAFIWTIFAAPLSVRLPRQGKAAGIFASILLVFIYYVLASAFRSLGGNNLIPPLVAAWVPNLIFAIGGVLLLIKGHNI